MKAVSKLSQYSKDFLELHSEIDCVKKLGTDLHERIRTLDNMIINFQSSVQNLITLVERGRKDIHDFRNDLQKISGEVGILMDRAEREKQC
jgi:uncharacterized coiled-coil DUF342 family protein